MSKSSLKIGHKLLIFFGGIFFVLFAGSKYFTKIPGATAKEKNLALILYYLGILFWIVFFAVLYFLF